MIKLLNLEGVLPKELHRRLRNFYKSSVENFQWGEKASEMKSTAAAREQFGLVKNRTFNRNRLADNYSKHGVETSKKSIDTFSGIDIYIDTNNCIFFLQLFTNFSKN